MSDQVIKVNRGEFEFTILDGDICHTPVGWDFWNDYFPEVFEPQTIKWMNAGLNKDRDFLDIGAWVGPTTIYGAKLARKVFAFEPDKAAFRYLEANVMYNNSNAEIFNAAIATTDTVEMFSRTFPGDSMSNMLGAGTPIDTVPGFTLEQAFFRGHYSMMKMDIEGGEAIVLPANKELLKEYKVPLILSLHGQFYREVDDFEKIIDAISVYNTFYDGGGNKITVNEIQNSFDVILCL